jgi:hypothetical protein
MPFACYFFIFINVGLGEAAKRDVGTGDNQIPDMGAFASGSGWFRLPGGYIVQFGTFAGNTTRFISGHFPIPFPNTQCGITGIATCHPGGVGGGWHVDLPVIPPFRRIHRVSTGR